MKTIPLFAFAGIIALFFVASFLPVQPAKAITCYSHASRQCISNISYWYNSCGVLEDLAQNCNATGQVCQSGQCVSKNPVTTITPRPTPQSSPVLVQAQNSQTASATIAVFGKNHTDSAQWTKNVSAATGSTIDVLIVVKNKSETPITDASVKTYLTSPIFTISDLQINNATAPSNDISQINLGTLAAKTAQIISFSATVQSPSVQPQANGATGTQIIANVTSGTATYDSDYLVVSTNAGNGALASATPTASPSSKLGSGFFSFNNNWFIWFLIVLVLVVIFIILFRRFSRE